MGFKHKLLNLIFLLAGLIGALSTGFSQTYKVTIDLKQVVEDRVKVKVEFIGFNLTESEYQMPKMVPGTYAITDFGLLVNQLEAFDTLNNPLTVNQLTINRWKIDDNVKLDYISYWVDDTFDGASFAHIFEPGGSNIQQDSNFVINPFAFIGYLKGFEKIPYEMTILHPELLYGASPLKRVVANNEQETFFADHYYQLTDSPIMYSKPDTSSVMIQNAQVMVSVYSPSGNLNADFVMEQLKPTLTAQGAYLGGQLPVDNYLIMVYLSPSGTNSSKYGALEHAYSTVFVLPDVSGDFLKQTFVDVTAHEFFHIITPLTIHSEEIGNYNFEAPKMSKHLWLYEGVTEYSSMIMQVQYGLISRDQFLEVITEKLDHSKGYNDTLPFTKMSLGALDRYKAEYANVYEKGALIGLCLDLLLLEESNGSYGIKELLTELGEHYGKNQSFKDDALFDQITEMTYPTVGAFFKNHVEGENPLPLKEYLAYAGVGVESAKTEKINTLGQVSLGFNAERDMLTIISTQYMNSFGQALGFQDGDLLYCINNERVNASNFNAVFDAYLNLPEGEKVMIEVLRSNEKGKEKVKKLKGKIEKITVSTGGSIYYLDQLTERQSQVQRAWLNPS